MAGTRNYGVSVEKVEEALKASEFPNVETIQIIFNMFRQRPADLFFEQAKKPNVGILARAARRGSPRRTIENSTGKAMPSTEVRRSSG